MTAKGIQTNFINIILQINRRVKETTFTIYKYFCIRQARSRRSKDEKQRFFIFVLRSPCTIFAQAGCTRNVMT